MLTEKEELNGTEGSSDAPEQRARVRDTEVVEERHGDQRKG